MQFVREDEKKEKTSCGWQQGVFFVLEILVIGSAEMKLGNIISGTRGRRAGNACCQGTGA